MKLIPETSGVRGAARRADVTSRSLASRLLVPLRTVTFPGRNVA